MPRGDPTLRSFDSFSQGISRRLGLASWVFTLPLAEPVRVHLAGALSCLKHFASTLPSPAKYDLARAAIKEDP